MVLGGKVLVKVVPEGAKISVAWMKGKFGCF